MKNNANWAELEALRFFQKCVDEYIKLKPSSKFWVWCVNTGYALDFSDDVIDIINSEHFAL